MRHANAKNFASRKKSRFCETQIDIAVTVITLSVAWCAVVVADRGTIRALGAFLRGDCLWVCVVEEVEPFSWIEVEGGFVDSVEVVDWGVEVLLRFE